MPEPTQVVDNKDADDKKPKETKKEELKMLMASLADDSVPQLNSQQIDKVLEDRAKVNEYIREDRKDKHEEFNTEKKNELHFLYVGAIFLLAVASIVAFVKPEYLGELVTGIVAGGGGYGIGKYKGAKEQKGNE